MQISEARELSASFMFIVLFCPNTDKNKNTDVASTVKPLSALTPSLDELVDQTTVIHFLNLTP